MKTKIVATLTKLNANASDKKDSIQFQMREESMEKYGRAVLELRRYDKVTITLEDNQSRITSTGVRFFKLEFQSVNTSVSICVTDKGLICTLTFSLDDHKVFDELVLNHLRNRNLILEFSPGANPNK